MNELEKCPDCGVAVGEPHINECDVERCSVCGTQRIACECEGHNRMMSVWTGQWPTHEEPQSRRLPQESEGLEPLIAGCICVGYEKDINGPGAELVNFEPTRAELKTLAYHYLDRFFAVQEIFALGQSGSFEIREVTFAWRRFESIAETLSPGNPLQEFVEYIDKGWAEVESVEKEIQETVARSDEASESTDV